MVFPTINKENPLILASASPRRKRLLDQIGLPFHSLPSHVSEEELVDKPSAIARSLAEKKAKTVVSKIPNKWILGADTIVVLGDYILGKPKNDEDARDMLDLLSGKEHEVVTGFCIIDPSGETAHSESVSTAVKVKPLRPDEIKAYIASKEPFGKAGSYAIQGIGSFMIEAISGSYTNVVGLPVCALVKSLLSLGAINNFPLMNT